MLVEQLRYQKAAMIVWWLILGVLALGAFLDSIANAVSLITMPIAIVGTIIALAAWGLLETVLATRGILWVKSGVKLRYIGLGSKTRAMFSGAILLLWVPTLVGVIQGDQLAKYVSIQNVDAYYYSIKSLEHAMPDPSVPVERTGVRLVPTDDQSQIGFMRLYQLRGHPVFEVTVRNSHPSEPIEITDVRVNLNRGQDWWGLNTHFIAPSRRTLVCGPKSEITFKGTPYIENARQRAAFTQLLYGNEPYDMVGAVRLKLASGGEVLSHRPFSLNKRNVREYNPDDF